MPERSGAESPGPEWPDAGSLGALYSSTFSLLRAGARPILGVSIAASAVTLGLQYASIVAARANQGSDAVASTLTYIVPLILYVLIGSLAAGAVSAIVAAQLVGATHVTIGTGLRAVAAVAKEALASALLATLLCLLLTFLLFFTTLLFLPFFYGPLLVMQGVVVQRLSFNRALSSARALARGSAGRLLAYALTASLSAWVIPVALVGLLEELDPPGFPWAYAPLQVVVEGAAAAFVAVAGAVIYFNCRMRKDDLGADELSAELA